MKKKYSENDPWIAKREACVCLWKPDYVRGFINNMNTSLLVDFSVFSDRQLEAYAKMMKACGFTGVQVTDMCSAWRPSGSPEFFHDRLRVFADALHRNGMEFTLWCWAAEFNGHGWHDEDVVYPEAGRRASDDPRIIAAFDKYYEIYALAAPFCDRVIAHYFDPGRLSDIDDVLFFLRRFSDKFRAVNPSVKIGVDTWGSPSDFPDRLVEAGFDDIMLMELPFLPGWRENGKRARFREGVKRLGCELGSWGWYTCEYETDQRPYLCVNNRVIADVYKQTREQADHVMVPSYWSEMDAYHVLNFFSLYAAGHLLTDPDADPDELLADSAALVAGNDGDAKKLLYVLETVRDARSGDSWDTYWWTEPGFALRKTDASDISERAARSLTFLEDMTDRRLDEAKVPLPLKAWQIFRLMLPHLEQIRQFADFRLGYAGMCDLYDRCGDCEEVREKMKTLSVPINEYNCITGLWGQPEADEQLAMLREFSARTGIAIPGYPPRDFLFKNRFVQLLSVMQRSSPGKRVWVNDLFYESANGIGADYARYIVGELVREGVFLRNEEGKVGLVNYDDLRFDFNI